jgi:hypothetical protein
MPSVRAAHHSRACTRSILPNPIYSHHPISRPQRHSLGKIRKKPNGCYTDQFDSEHA